MTKKTKIARDLINKHYQFFGYIAFTNMFKELKKRALQIKSSSVGDQEAIILMIKNVFSNRVIIIDEAHNTNPNSELMIKKNKEQKSLKMFPECIKTILRYSENTKLILLTATPINNSPKEIIWLLNLLLLNDNRGTIKINEVFDEAGNFKPDGQELLLKKSIGYISHIRSENPITYPERKNLKTTDYFRIYRPGVSNKKNVLLLDDGRDSNNYRYIPLIDSPMSYEQYTNYLYNINKDNEDVTKIFTFKKGIDKGSGIIAQQNLIVMYPSKKGTEIDPLFLSNTDEECFKKEGKLLVYNDWCENFLKIDNIGRYSSKYKTFLKCAEKAEGIVIVHVRYVNMAKTLAMALEDNGYSSVNVPGFSDDTLLKTDAKKNGFSYTLITGATEKKKLGKIIDFSNKPNNIEGKQLKVIIVTDVAKEGLSFFNVREIHIMTPWWHINRLEQIIGRGMRQCSHKLLDKENRNVGIFYHSSTIPELTTLSDDNNKSQKDRRGYKIDNTKVDEINLLLKEMLPDYEDLIDNKWTKDNLLKKETYDEYLYWVSLNKARKIAPTESLLKSNAVDCNLNKSINANVKRDWEDEYECLPNVDEEITPNMNTYTLNFAINDINKAKSIIRQLFETNWAYKLNTIKEKINNMVHNNGQAKISDLYILYALDDFVKNKLEIKDYLGRTGHLIYVPLSDKVSYYVFQPNELDDTTIPMSIREKPLSIKESKLDIYTETSDDIKAKTKISKHYTDKWVKIVKKFVDLAMKFSLEKDETINIIINNILKNNTHGFLVDKILFYHFFDLLETYELIIITKMIYREDKEQLKEFLNFSSKKTKTSILDNCATKDGLEIVFKNCFENFYQKLFIKELFEELGILVVPDVKLDELIFYKSRDDGFRKIIEGSENMNKVLDFYKTRESVDKKNNVVLVSDKKYGFKHSDNKLESYGYLKQDVGSNNFKFYTLDKDLKKGPKLTKNKKVDKKSQPKGKTCGTNRPKVQYIEMINNLTDKEFKKDSKNDYYYAGINIELGLNKVKISDLCEIIKYFMYYNRVLIDDKMSNKLTIKYRYENIIKFRLPQLIKAF